MEHLEPDADGHQGQNLGVAMQSLPGHPASNTNDNCVTCQLPETEIMVLKIVCDDFVSPCMREELCIDS